MRRVRIFLGLVVGAALSVGVGVYAYGASGSEGVPPAFDAAHSDLSTSEVRAFNDFALYSAGGSFEGLPLVAITRRLDPPLSEIGVPLTVRANFVSHIYGDCEATSDSGCAPPLQIQVWPACERNLSVYPTDDWFKIERTTVRGVPAAFFEEGARLEVYSGDVTIVVFGLGKEHVRRAAEALQPVNMAASAAHNLPSPRPGALEGRLGC
jgi:hypothetical protein